MSAEELNDILEGLSLTDDLPVSPKIASHDIKIRSIEPDLESRTFSGASDVAEFQSSPLARLSTDEPELKYGIMPYSDGALVLDIRKLNKNKNRVLVVADGDCVSPSSLKAWTFDTNALVIYVSNSMSLLQQAKDKGFQPVLSSGKAESTDAVILFLISHLRKREAYIVSNDKKLLHLARNFSDIYGFSLLVKDVE